MERALNDALGFAFDLRELPTESKTMRTFLIAAAAATAAMAMGAAAPANAFTLPGGGGLSGAGAAVNIVDDAQVMVYRGRRYCFYINGWNGPGWYRCGYAWRSGFGFGGVYGWNRWYLPRYHTRFYHGRGWDRRRDVRQGRQQFRQNQRQQRRDVRQGRQQLRQERRGGRQQFRQERRGTQQQFRQQQRQQIQGQRGGGRQIQGQRGGNRSGLRAGGNRGGMGGGGGMGGRGGGGMGGGR
jgi:hypothetical protein